MNDIFISYSRKDKDWVETLASALEAEGYDVWWDPEILPGQDYESVIKNVLDNTQCVLTVWSENAIQSHWVRGETSRGLQRNVYIPVLLQQIEVPIQFGHIQSANLIDWQGKTDDSRYQKLLRALALKVETPQKAQVKVKKNQNSRPDSDKEKRIEQIGQYIDHGDGTVTDTKTGLMWKKCSEGQTGDDCSGEAKIYTWHDAMQKFKQVSFAGYSDWRMPTIEELRTIDGKPTILNDVFPQTAYNWYWSSSPYAGSSNGAWYIDFSGGLGGINDKYISGRVRLVRSGQ